MWRPEISASVTPVNCNHVRLCCVKRSLDDDSFLLIFNLYMPCDNKNQDANYHDYVDIMNEIEEMIYASNPSYVICGE